MDRIDFDCTFDLANTITALLGDFDDDYPVISVYGKYAVIKELLEDLIMNGTVIANEIELQDYDIAHYDREFVLYLTMNGINVEKVWHDNRYYYGSANISFVHEDCSSKLLKYVGSKTVYEFGITKENRHDDSYDIDDEYDCCGCDLDECIHCGDFKPDKCVEYSKDDDGDMHGFFASRSDGNSYYGYSFYTSDKLGMDDIRSLLKDIGF